MDFADKVQHYDFKILDHNILNEKNMKETLYRWNLNDSLKIYKFRYDYEFLTYNINVFIEDLLSSLDLFTKFKTNPETSGLEFKLQNASLLNTNFLDRLIEADLVSGNGEINQMIPKYKDDLEISTKLLQMLLKYELEEDDISYLFDDIDNELLFDIFKILMIGGKYNQRDFDIDTYRECLKQIYRQLVE